MDGLSGIASGIDTASIVQKLMDVERAGETRLQLRQSSIAGQKSALTGIASKLAALKTAASALRSPDTWKQVQAVSTSDVSRVTVTKTGGVGSGGHAIQVDRLAASAQRSFVFPTPPGAASTLELTAKGGSTVKVDIAAGATAQTIADQLNARDDVPVYAAVAGGRLVLSSRTTGDDGTFTVGGTLLSGGTMTETSNKLTDLDAQYRLDGETTVRTSHSNAVDDAVAGLRIGLKAVTTSPVSVTVDSPALDQDKVKTALKAFVSAYNDVVTTTRTALSEKKVADASTSTDAAKGQLFGDLGLTSMLSQLKQGLQGAISGLGTLDDLGDVGISVPKTTGGTSSDDGKAGKLVLDEDVLTKALSADWTQVKKLFAGTGTTGGFAKQVEDFVTKQTGGSGILDGRLESATNQNKLLSDQLTRMDDALSAKETRLKAQFAAMESALQASQTQQTWLTAQLAQLG
jgi:flagellar hook-associated protein 2